MIQHQRTLHYPISHEQVQTAAAKLKNHPACDPDLIPNKLLKYACICELTALSLLVFEILLDLPVHA